MSDLEAELDRIAASEPLLVAADFDGTLAPIAGTPDEVRRDRVACRALFELSRLPRTTVAVISGRALGALRELLGEDAAGLRLIGSHGAEPDDGPSIPVGLGNRDPDLVEAFESLACRFPGSLVERKPFGIAFHTRGVDRGEAEAAAREAGEAVRRSGARLQQGHEVVEAVFGEGDKGSALDSLRRSIGAAATIFVGDDVTDERAFERLEPGDLGVKVGPGRTAATARIGGQPSVAPLFERLLEARRLHASKAHR